MSFLENTEKPDDFISSENLDLPNASNEIKPQKLYHTNNNSKKKLHSKKLTFSTKSNKWKHVQSKVKLYIEECKAKDAMAYELRDNLKNKTPRRTSTLLTIYTGVTPKRESNCLEEIKILKQQVEMLSSENSQLRKQLKKAKIRNDFFHYIESSPSPFPMAKLKSDMSPDDMSCNRFENGQSSTPVASKSRCIESYKNLNELASCSYVMQNKSNMNETSTCSEDVMDVFLPSPMQNYSKLTNVSGRKSNRLSLGIMQPIIEENKLVNSFDCPKTLPRITKAKKRIFSDLKFKHMLWRHKKKDKGECTEMNQKRVLDLENAVTSIYTDQKYLINQVLELQRKVDNLDK